MRSVRGAIAGLLACALAATTTGGTVDAALSLKQVGGSNTWLIDMTPDGRYVVLGSDEVSWGQRIRIDVRTGARRTFPTLDHLAIRPDGRYVFGIDPDTNQVVRYEIATGRRRVYRLPRAPYGSGMWLAHELALSSDGSTIGHGGTLDVSGNGRCVLFWSERADLVAGTTTKAQRYYLRDLTARRTIRVMVPVSRLYEPWEVEASINHDGSRLAIPVDGKIRVGARLQNGLVPVLFNPSTRRITKVMKTVDGGAPRGGGLYPFARLHIDAYGVKVGFTSWSTNLANSRGRGARSYVASVT